MEWGIAGTTKDLPNCFLDISDYLDTKLQVLGVYEEELRDFPHPSVKPWRLRWFLVQILV